MDWICRLITKGKRFDQIDNPTYFHDLWTIQSRNYNLSVYVGSCHWDLHNDRSGFPYWFPKVKELTRSLLQLMSVIHGPSDIEIAIRLCLWTRINDICAVTRVDLQIKSPKSTVLPDRRFYLCFTISWPPNVGITIYLHLWTCINEICTAIGVDLQINSQKLIVWLDRWLACLYNFWAIGLEIEIRLSLCARTTRSMHWLEWIWGSVLEG